jgi:2-dehydro-3-deoxyphosphogluconate aldolase/(4S)-4-hydroxy-2-oxoglutarate aldolase
MHTTQRLSAFEGQRVVPLAAPTNAAQTRALHRGLVDGGLNIVEIGLRTPYSMTALSELAEDDDLIVGAGTVMDAAHAETALSAGAQFLVSPGFADDVLDTARRHNTPYVPGIATPTEMMRAWQKGLRLVKLFPANALGGLKFIDALQPAFRDMTFMPSGGVSSDNLAEHLAHPAVAMVSGSWMTSTAMLDRGAADVARSVRSALETASGARA